MKRKLLQIFTISLALFLGFSVTTEAQVDWGTMTAYPLDWEIVAAEATDAADLSVTAKTAWDADSIYIFVDVTDDSLTSAHANSWERDQVEIYFDMGNEKALTYDANDMSQSYRWDEDNSAKYAGDNYEVLETANGYTVEVAIPWDSLLLGFTAVEGMVIGYDIEVIDNDGFDRENKVAMMAAVDEAWRNPSYMGDLTLIAGGATEPNPWDFLDGHSLDFVIQGEDLAASDLSATTKAVWDADSLYIQVEITDDSLTSAHANSWERDQVEIYFDMGNEKTVGAYDDNDLSHSYRWNEDNSAKFGGDNYMVMETANGWAVHVAIPWDSLMLGFTPAEGTVIGYDIEVIDNDGANREHKIALMAAADEAWHYAEYMGELTLLADGITEPNPWLLVPGYAVERLIVDDVDPTAEDLSATTKALWDADSLYIQVEITDDSLTSAHANSWERDQVEFYFDMGNEKTVGAYDDNDLSHSYRWNEDNDAKFGGDNYSVMETENGWSVYVNIPWDSLMLGFTPAVGTLIGYDVEIIDNDGVNRESKIAFMATQDDAWHYAEYMGTLELAADGETKPIYPEYPALLEDVTINVDVNGLIDGGVFVVGTDAIDFAGTFNNWGDPTGTTTTEAAGIYTGTVADQEVGTLIEFKTRVNDDWGFSELPDGGANRTHTVVEGANVIDIVWNDGDMSPWVTVELHDGSSVVIYPNPASSTLYIKDAENISTIELINMTGQVTMKHSNASSTTSISLENQKPGVYMVRFINSKNEVSYTKLMIQ